MLLEYQNIKTFLQQAIPNWSEEIFVVKKIKNTEPLTYVISDLKGEEIVGMFYEKKLQKANHKEFRVEKVIKRKGGKLYVKVLCYKVTIVLLTIRLIKRTCINELIFSRTIFF